VASRCVSVVIADRHPVVLCGLNSILSAERDFKVVASCGDAKTCIEIVRDRSPDLVLLDPFLPGDPSGRQLLAAIKSDHARTRVVFFLSYFEIPQTAAAIARGAYGLIPKEAPQELLLRSLWKVASGQRVLPSAIRDTKPRMGRKSGARPLLKKLQTALTEREREITQLVSEGLSNKEIARQLNLSDGTIRAQLHQIYQKLAIQNRTMLVTLASRDLSVA
jgi:two-component system, NarL family, nitrate/nitrite response regulator NarL